MGAKETDTRSLAWSQHWHFCWGTMMMATSFWTESSQVMKCGLHTSLQKPNSSQCIGITVNLPARRNSGRLCLHGNWYTRYAETDGTSWPEVRRWMLSVTAKHCRNCDGPFRTSGDGCLVPVLSCSTIKLGHARLDGQHISCRSSAGRYLMIYSIARTSRTEISIFSYTSCPVSISIFRMRDKWRWDECHTVIPIPGGRLLWHRDTTVDPTYDKCLKCFH